MLYIHTVNSLKVACVKKYIYIDILDVTLNLLPWLPRPSPLLHACVHLAGKSKWADVTHLVALSVHQLLPVPLTFYSSQVKVDRIQ